MLLLMHRVFLGMRTTLTNVEADILYPDIYNSKSFKCIKLDSPI